MDQYLIKII